MKLTKQTLRNMIKEEMLNEVGTNVSKTVIGTSCTLRASSVNTLFGSNLQLLQATLTVEGRDCGARVTIPVSITKTIT